MTDREKRDGRSNGGWGSGKDFLRFHGSYSIYILKDYCPYSQRGCKWVCVGGGSVFYAEHPLLLPLAPDLFRLVCFPYPIVLLSCFSSLWHQLLCPQHTIRPATSSSKPTSSNWFFPQQLAPHPGITSPGELTSPSGPGLMYKQARGCRDLSSHLPHALPTSTCRRLPRIEQSDHQARSFMLHNHNKTFCHFQQVLHSRETMSHMR